MPLEDEIWHQKTRIMGLPYGEDIMIVGQTMWAQSTTVTDGQTDGQIYYIIIVIIIIIFK